MNRPRPASQQMETKLVDDFLRRELRVGDPRSATEVAAALRARYDSERAKGLTEGLQKGRTAEAREVCVNLTRALHPTVARRVGPVIEACSDLKRLRRWALEAHRLPDVEFTQRVTGSTGSRAARGPAPRTRPKDRRSDAR